MEKKCQKCGKTAVYKDRNGTYCGECASKILTELQNRKKIIASNGERQPDAETQ